MLKALMTSAALLTFAAPALAHEIWIEQDSSGPARIYFGEPTAAVADPEEPNALTLKKPLLFQADKNRAITTTKGSDHLTADIRGTGDVRLYDETAFDPWDNDGVKNAALFYARAGRTETAAKLDFELVPTKAGGDHFTVQFQGKALPNADVTIIAPGKWQKNMKADAQGVIAVPNQGAGRYILVANHNEDASRVIGGVTVSKLQHVTTLSYISQ